MDLNKKVNYWFKKYLTVSILGFFIISGIVILSTKGYNYSATALFGFAIGAAFLYRHLKEQNEIIPNKAVVLIGCDSGLGYSLALYCRSLGFSVIASVLKKDSPNVKEMSQAGIHIFELDITIPESVKNFGFDVRECLKRENLALYALVNNAGLMVIGDFEWQTEEQMLRQVNVNVIGTMRITKEMLPLLRNNKSRIIFISSHCSVESLPGFSIYGGTKSAIRAWANSLRVELEKQGIAVVCFAPGSFFMQSGIMSRQAEYFKEMRESMSLEVKNFHNDHFNRTVKFFETVTSYIQPQKLNDSMIYSTFQDTLLDKHPSIFYECCPWRYTYYHTLCKVTPTCVRDMLIKKFTQVPR